jgi:hypothetical protein
MFAYYAGTDLYIVDTYGLGDPLLAKLPALEQTDFLYGISLEKSQKAIGSMIGVLGEGVKIIIFVNIVGSYLC